MAYDYEKIYLKKILTGKNITILLQQVDQQNQKILNGEGLPPSDIKIFLQAYAVIRCIPRCENYADLRKTFKISVRQIENCRKIMDALEKDKSILDLAKMLVSNQLRSTPKP